MIRIWISSMYYLLFFPPNFKSIQRIRVFSSKMVFDAPFLTILDHLLFFSGAFEQKI